MDYLLIFLSPRDTAMAIQCRITEPTKRLFVWSQNCDLLCHDNRVLMTCICPSLLYHITLPPVSAFVLFNRAKQSSITAPQ
jgi:hypothetical protein